MIGAAAAATLVALAGACSAAGPTHVALPEGFRPSSIATADFNADGNPDVVVAGLAGEAIVLLGDGHGGLDPRPPVPGGENPDGIAATPRFVVIANHETDHLTLLVGDGTGDFSPRTLHVHSNPHPHAVTLGDFDGDGTPDIAFDSWMEHRIMLLFGRDGWQGPGTPLDIGARPYWTISTADLDGDGNLDLVTPNWGHGTVTILLGDGEGHFAQAPGSPYAAGPAPFSAAIADLDGDGRLDVAVASYSGHASDTADDGLTWIRNDGSRHFTPFARPAAKGDYSARVATGDVNGDGITDAAFTNGNVATVTVVYGSRAGLGASASYPVQRHPHNLAVADLDRDGRAEILVISEEDDEIVIVPGR